jgi:hypothetical protein
MRGIQVRSGIVKSGDVGVGVEDRQGQFTVRSLRRALHRSINITRQRQADLSVVCNFGFSLIMAVVGVG